jgi:hypothetical protein
MLKRAKRPNEALKPAHAAGNPQAVTDDSGFSMTAYDMMASAERFDEPVRGLQTRELRSPDIFQRFFGASA